MVCGTQDFISVPRTPLSTLRPIAQALAHMRRHNFAERLASGKRPATSGHIGTVVAYKRERRLLMSWILHEMMLNCSGQGLVWVLATRLPPAVKAGDRVKSIPGCFT